jgi:glycerophosphoryl diester phosphodiesterase
MSTENLDYLYRGRMLNFAHRGANTQAPANTLSAFRLAAELGADGVELDVQLSKDGEVVVIHDFAVDATTNGSGAVAERTLAELQALDAGSWFDVAFAGEHIPTLQEVMDAVGHRLLLNIEIKLPFTLANTGLEAEVVRLIEDNNLVDRMIISSFHPLALRRVKSLNRHISTGLLYAHDLPIYLRRAWLAPLVPHEARHPDFAMVTPAYVQMMKAGGYRINVWTVDDPGEMRRLLDLGVDAIITNRPDVLRQVMSQPPVYGGA